MNILFNARPRELAFALYSARPWDLAFATCFLRCLCSWWLRACGNPGPPSSCSIASSTTVSGFSGACTARFDAWSLPFPCIAGAPHPISSVPTQHETFGVPVFPSFATLSFGKVYATPWHGKNQGSAGPSGTPCMGFRQTASSPTVLLQDPLTSHRLILHPVTGAVAFEQTMGTENPST